MEVFRGAGRKPDFYVKINTGDFERPFARARHIFNLNLAECLPRLRALATEPAEPSLNN